MISLISEDQNIEKFTTDQLHIFWLPTEIRLEKDIQCVLTEMSEAEKHGIITTLKLFSIYEVISGEEFWSSRFKQIFPDKIEFLKMASVFSMFELAIHLPFYKKLNELLYIDTDDFYNSYVRDETLRDRIEFINDIIDSRDDLLSLALFSLVEGAILYSSFAFIKHFQSQGMNKLLNIVRGINFSLKDENIHSIASAYCFKLKLQEAQLDDIQKEVLFNKIREGAQKLFEHESRIVDMIFEKGKMASITELQMKNFVQSRINVCLRQLGLENIYEVKHNPIAQWFYDNINALTFNDFFTGVGSQYNRNWSESEFKW